MNSSVSLTKQHILHPFTYKVSENGREETKSLSREQKIAAIAVSILIGIPTYVVGGVIAFYAITAYFKNRKVEANPQNTEKMDEVGRIRFGVARAREFDKYDPPEDIANIRSNELHNLQKVEGPQRQSKRRISRAANLIRQRFSNLFTSNDTKTFSFIPERRYPPPSLFVDTVMFTPDKSMVSIHDPNKEAVIFRDEEILYIHPVVKEKVINQGTGNSPITAQITRNGKAVIQQQATRGCTAAVTAMLIYDLGGQVNTTSLMSRNLGDDDDMINDLKHAGLTPIVHKDLTDLEQAKELIKKDGSAIISISDPVGGNHVVVVDHINDDGSVIIRDPFHGWQITVTEEALMSRLSPKERIIQAKSNIFMHLSNCRHTLNTVVRSDLKKLGLL